MDGALKAEDFEPHVGRTFRVADTPHVLRLEQVEAQEGEPPPGFSRRPFSLIFRGPKPGPVLPEGVHTLEAEGGFRFVLHVAPIHTPQRDRQDYQSVFA